MFFCEFLVIFGHFGPYYLVLCGKSKDFSVSLEDVPKALERLEGFAFVGLQEEWETGQNIDPVCGF